MNFKDLKIGDRFTDKNGEHMIIGTNHLGQLILINEKDLVYKSGFTAKNK